MITSQSLKAQTSKDLAQLAKKKGVSGWHSMRKEQLIKAILKVAKAKNIEKKSAASATRGDSGNKTGVKSSKQAISGPSISKPIHASSRQSTRSKRESGEIQVAESAIAKKIRHDRQAQENRKNLSLVGISERSETAPTRDRLILIVRDSFWVQAYWEITKSTVQRAKVALNGQWHQARPVLRLLEITNDGNTNAVENLAGEIEIHGGVKNWFFRVPAPGQSYRMAIGYAVPDGRFHLICKSNQIMTPNASASSIDENWTDITNDAEKYYALSGGYDPNVISADLQEVFEEKTRQPMNAPAFERLGSGINGYRSDFEFHVEAHMIVYGTTNPNGSVSIGGEPVRLNRDGTFSLKVDLPDKRQVLPIVASSRDGTQQRTTVLAIERNTKVMEPFSNDMDNS